MNRQELEKNYADCKRRIEILDYRRRLMMLDMSEKMRRLVEAISPEEECAAELRGWITKNGHHILIGDDGGSGGSSGGSSAKRFDKAEKSGIMKDSSDEWFPITNKSIENVHNIDIFSSHELNQNVTEKCKEILKDLKNDKVGTEETISINIETLKSQKLKGEQGVGGVKFISMDSPYVAIHNHPSNETFSNRDLEVFWGERLCQSIIVVGNKGNIFVMEKAESYDALGFFQHIMSEKLGFTKYKSKIDFLKGAEKHGLKYHERTN